MVTVPLWMMITVPVSIFQPKTTETPKSARFEQFFDSSNINFYEKSIITSIVLYVFSVCYCQLATVYATP